MLQSLIIYSSLILMMIFFGIIASQRTFRLSKTRSTVAYLARFEIIFPMILFAIVFGLRYDVGIDYLGYLDNYLNGISDKFEPFFR